MERATSDCDAWVPYPRDLASGSTSGTREASGSNPPAEHLSFCELVTNWVRFIRAPGGGHLSVPWRYECHLSPRWCTSADVEDSQYRQEIRKGQGRERMGAKLICFICMEVIGAERTLGEHLGKHFTVVHNNEEGARLQSPVDECCYTEKYADADVDVCVDVAVDVETETETEIDIDIEDDDDHEGQFDSQKILRVVETTRQNLPDTRNLLHPMRYGVIDLTGRHTQSVKLLKPWYEQLQKDFQDCISYQRHELTEKEKKLILGLDEDVRTEEEKSLKALGGICDQYGRFITAIASEQTHIQRHFAHYIEISEPKGTQWQSEWGEITLKASYENRNKISDPEERARLGQRCDYLLSYKGHAFHPELLIGEVAGGLPAGTSSKTWYDFLVKLVLGSRDCLLRLIEKSGEKGKSSVMYSFQLIGFQLIIYAVGYFHGMWRVMVVDECFLPASNQDKESRIEVYCVLRSLMEAVQAEAQRIRRMLNSSAYDVGSSISPAKRPVDDNVFIVNPVQKK